MAHVISVNKVSKQYQLGLTRTSLPQMLRQFGKKLVSGSQNESAEHLWALRDISFSLDKGESLALVGPNGAGKSTILKILSRVTKPTSGHFEVSGRLSALIELGSGFHPDLTGRENIFLNGTILGIPRNEIEKRFDEIVAFSNLDRFIDTPIKRYSSGMIVRLGFAVASAIEPEILLVDEVLAVGDAAFRKKCMDRIAQLLRQGTSIVFVSHNLWLVQAVCEKALLIDKGQVQLAGPTSDIISAYDRLIHEQRMAELNKDTVEASDRQKGALLSVQDVLIHSKTDPGATEFQSGDTVELSISYIAKQDLGAATAVFRIIRSDGLSCCMLRTSLDNYPIRLAKGHGTISVTLDPLQLYGGSYYIQGLIRDATDAEGIDSAQSAPFYVTGAPLNHQDMNGVFLPNHVWHQEAI